MNDIALSALIRRERPHAEPSEVERRPGFLTRLLRADIRKSVLAHMINSDIVPRLVLAHQPPAPPESAAPRPEQAEIDEVTALVLAGNIAEARLCAEAVLSRGVDFESLSLDLLAPAARRMGAMWVEDVCDFTAVSIGVWRLYQILRDLSPRLPRVSPIDSRSRRILLTVLPGEQHCFGMSILADFFRNAGWQVFPGPVTSIEELGRLVSGRWFAVVGISLSWSARIETLAASIRDIRRNSRNKTVGIMVGGGLFSEQPELVRLVGADATAPDARSAPAQAERLVSLMGACG